MHFYLIKQWKIYNGCLIRWSVKNDHNISNLHWDSISTEVWMTVLCKCCMKQQFCGTDSICIQNVSKINPVLQWSFLLSPHQFPFFLSPLSPCLCQILNSSAEWAFGWLNIYKAVLWKTNMLMYPVPPLSSYPYFHLLHLGCKCQSSFTREGGMV